MSLIEDVVLLKSASTKTKKNKGVRELRVLSLFSGGGGMDLGLEGGFEVLSKSVNTDLHPEFVEKSKGKFSTLKRSKFTTVFANDIFDSARKNWIHYFNSRGVSDKVFHSDSIVDLVKRHRQGEKVFPNTVDVVTGGFPCQDFSLSGKRNGFKSHKDHNGNFIEESIPTVETRGKLYMWMKEVIEITKPNIFIAENVKGMASLGDVVKVIRKDFASAGYLVFAEILHSADYGVPQSRERIIFIGIKKSSLNPKVRKDLEDKKSKSEYYPFPKPTHDYTKEDETLWPFVRLKEIFKGMKEPDESSDLSHQSFSRAKFMGKHCQGQAEIKLDHIGPTIRSEHHGNIEFRRLSLRNGGKYRDELKSGKKERRLSVRECALIQTFPPDYEFVVKSSERKNKFLVSPSEAYKVIGNAVPPLLAFHVGQRIEELWNKFFES